MVLKYMKKLIISIIAVISVMSSSSAMAIILDIDFNGSQFLLGAFESAETGADFYNYGSPFAASANPVYPGTTDPIPLAADALQIFSHINTLTNELSFGIILEKPDGSGGGSFATTASWSVPAVLSFVDDPGEDGPIGSAGPVDITLSWIDCCTDGFVISGFDPTNLFLDLFDTSGSDLTDVIFLSPDMINTSFVFPEDEFNISITNCDPATDPDGCVISTVPEPSIVWLLSIGLAILGFTRRKKI